MKYSVETVASPGRGLGAKPPGSGPIPLVGDSPPGILDRGLEIATKNREKQKSSSPIFEDSCGVCKSGKKADEQKKVITYFEDSCDLQLNFFFFLQIFGEFFWTFWPGEG